MWLITAHILSLSQSLCYARPIFSFCSVLYIISDMLPLDQLSSILRKAVKSRPFSLSDLITQMNLVWAEVFFLMSFAFLAELISAADSACCLFHLSLSYLSIHPSPFFCPLFHPVFYPTFTLVPPPPVRALICMCWAGVHTMGRWGLMCVCQSDSVSVYAWMCM